MYRLRSRDCFIKKRFKRLSTSAPKCRERSGDAVCTVNKSVCVSPPPSGTGLVRTPPPRPHGAWVLQSRGRRHLPGSTSLPASPCAKAKLLEPGSRGRSFPSRGTRVPMLPSPRGPSGHGGRGGGTKTPGTSPKRQLRISHRPAELSKGMPQRCSPGPRLCGGVGTLCQDTRPVGQEPVLRH